MIKIFDHHFKICNVLRWHAKRVFFVSRARKHTFNGISTSQTDKQRTTANSIHYLLTNLLISLPSLYAIHVPLDDDQVTAI